MKSRGFLASLLIILSLNGAQAYPRGGAAIPSGPGIVNLNVGGGDSIPANFTNIFKASTVNIGTNSPALFDDDGYAIGTLTALTSVTFSAGSYCGSTTAPIETCTLSWDADITSQWTFLGINTGCVATNATVSGCVGGNVTITTQAGLAGSVTWTASTLAVQLPSGFTYARTAGGTVSLRAASQVGSTHAWSSQYRAFLTALKPGSLRNMGFVNSSTGGAGLSTERKWKYRAAPSSFSWVNNNRYFATAWGGAVTGTDIYTLASLPSDVSAGAWVSGETVQGNIANTPTLITISNAANNGSGLCRITVNSTAALTTGQVVWVAGIADSVTGVQLSACSGLTLRTITVIDGTHIDLQGTTFSGTPRVNTGQIGTQTLAVTGKSASPVFMASGLGLPTGNFQSDFSTGNTTCWYDEILVRMMCTKGGISSYPPIEKFAELANDIGSGLWPVIPVWADDDYATNWGTALFNTLNAPLPSFDEYGNEVWNNGMTHTSWASQRGVAMGFTQDSSRAVFGWYGLRVREIMGNILAPIWASRPAQFQPVLAYQAAGGTTTSTYRFGGADLAPLGTHGGQGNSVYNTYTGSADYTQAGQRPGDKVKHGAYAPYMGGANLNQGVDISGGAAPNASNAPFYQLLVNAWEAGNTAAAIALVDDDIRQGRTGVQTVTASGTTFTTPAAHGLFNGSQVAFQVTGGTSFSGLSQGALYNVTGTSSAGCPGAVTCNFTMQGFSGGFPAGSNINAGSAGTGTVTVGWVGGAGFANTQTMQALNSNWYRFAETLGATFNIFMSQYEGNPEPVGSTSAQCAALGVVTPTPITINFTANTSVAAGGLTNISSTTGLIKGMTITGPDMPANALISGINTVTLAAIITPVPTGTHSAQSLTATGDCGTDQASAITAWKVSGLAKATIQTYYDQSRGLDPNMAPTFGLQTHAKAPSHLVIMGTSTDANNPATNAYGLLLGNMPTNPPTPITQMYCGIQAYDGGSGGGC